MKKNNKNTENTAAEYAAVKTVKDFLWAVEYQLEEELDALLKAYPALTEISEDDISDFLCGCGGWSCADKSAEITIFASKVRKVNHLLGTAVMVVLEKGTWGVCCTDGYEIYYDAVNWHFGFPTTAECCLEMHAARKRLHAEISRPYIPYIDVADDDWDPEDDWDK